MNGSLRRRRIAEGFPGARHINIPDDVIENATLTPVCNGLFPTRLGYFKFADGHYCERPEGASENILIGCVAGEGVCRSGDEEWRIQPNEIVFLPADTPHCYEAKTDNPWTIMWFHYIGGQCDQFHAAIGISKSRPVIRVSNIGELRTAFEQVYEHTQMGYSTRELFCLSTNFGRFLSQCAYYRRSRAEPRRKAEEKIIHTVEFMKKNLHRQITSPDLAAIAGFSTTYFSFAFRQYMGASPTQFLMELRLQLACSRLKVTDMTISEVAQSVGYCDPFYFSKIFRRRFKTSPSDYRKFNKVML